MFAVAALVAFAVGAVLDLLDITADYGWLLWVGLALLAAHLVWAVPIPRRP